VHHHKITNRFSQDAAEKAGLLDWESIARAQFRQGVTKGHNLGTMALTKRGGGRVLGVKVEPAFVPVPLPVSGANAPSVDADGAPDAKSSSSSSSSGSGAGGASSGPALSTGQIYDELLQIDGDVPCSPSSRPAGRDSSQAQRAAALAVGLVSAGASDIISRW
jgi:hypothetical protein